MIKANELRPGNLVYLTYECQVVNGTNDLSGMIHLVGNGVENREDQIFPIPISPKWLERLGKPYNNDDRQWEYQIHVGALNWFFRWNTEWYSELGCIYLGSRIQYLHQLQNLYFDLTGEEITITQLQD